MSRSALLSSSLALLILTGCRTPMSAEFGQVLDRGLPELGQQVTLETAVGPVQVEYAEHDAEAANAFRVAVEKAAPKLVRWGRLDAPLRILLVNHDQLEWHTGRHGYPWLRAWARHDDLLFQSPSTFPVRPPTPEELEEMVLHELTHSVMFQRAATTTSWRRKHIPLWFREGMATYTADQGYQYPALEDIARYYRSRTGLDPISSPEPLYQGDREIVYASAHHAFAYFIKVHGEAPVLQIIDRMAEGPAFTEAFTEVTAQTPEAFLGGFKQFVTSGSFRTPPRFITPPAASPLPVP